jgi:hypothetical protein
MPLDEADGADDGEQHAPGAPPRYNFCELVSTGELQRPLQ